MICGLDIVYILWVVVKVGSVGVQSGKDCRTGNGMFGGLWECHVDHVHSAGGKRGNVGNRTGAGGL